MVHGKNSLQYDTKVPERVVRGSFVRFQHHVTFDVGISEYTFEVGLSAMNHYDYEHQWGYTHRDLHAKITRLCHLPNVGYFSVVWCQNGGPVQLQYYGVANLPGNIDVHVVTSTPL